MNRRKTLPHPKSGAIGHEDLFELEKDDFKEPDTWTIITAMNRVLELSEDSRLSNEFWEKCWYPILVKLNKKLGWCRIIWLR